ncbi:MAG: bifunctional adenosylcobinamide kinase/adenosylcobinamide-phosphate guanylyltransferase [Lachnospiraceae bacterium]
MNMIIGGSFQGKLRYAQESTGITAWVDGEHCTLEQMRSAEGIFHFERFIYKELREGRSIQNLAEELITHNPDVVIVSTEVGSGIVPMDALDREWREQTGRVCTRLAAFSSQVTRIICGIPMVIKHD